MAKIKEKHEPCKKNINSGPPVASTALKTGLSNTSHLTADVLIKKRQNLECQMFVHEKWHLEKATKRPEKRGRKKGQIVQQGLTRRGRKTIRVVSDCYNSLLTDKHFRDNIDVTDNYLNTSCRFITLTFRNILFSDKEAKRLLDSFFKRLTRLFGRKIHYLWVAERQKRGVIHFHILTPENFDLVLGEGDVRKTNIAVNTWVNRSWNEVVRNFAYKNSKITKEQSDAWKQEYKLSENYYKSLMAFKMGERKTQPRKPRKSQFLLLPNVVKVLKAGNYMAKYMSKEGQNIVGGLYGASKLSREFMHEQVVCKKNFNHTFLANKVVKYVYQRCIRDNVRAYLYCVQFNETLVLWCENVYAVQGYYFEYMELLKIRKEKKRTKEKQLQLTS